MEGGFSSILSNWWKSFSPGILWPTSANQHLDPSKTSFPKISVSHFSLVMRRQRLRQLRSSTRPTVSGFVRCFYKAVDLLLTRFYRAGALFRDFQCDRQICCRPISNLSQFFRRGLAQCLCGCKELLLHRERNSFGRSVHIQSHIWDCGKGNRFVAIFVAIVLKVHFNRWKWSKLTTSSW